MMYKIELTEEQYNHIIRCVEVCHRISCGDVRELKGILPIDPEDSLLDEIKHQAFPELELHQSYKWCGGYTNSRFGEPFRKEYDKFQAQGYQIYRQMRHVQSVAKGIDNVYSSETLTTDKAKQPIIEVIDE